MFGLLLLAALAALSHIPSNAGPIARTPLILIPGDGGSQLYAKLNKSEVVHYSCWKQTDYYYSLWLNLELLTPYELDCTVDNLRLQYDPVTHQTSNSPGVDVRTYDFGSTEGVEWLDPSDISVSSYYAPLVKAATEQHGYTRGKDVFGAPFDFRKAPNELKDFYYNLTHLIESSYSMNGRPALVVCHSLGNLVFTYFMSHQTQAWKDKYVAGFVALSAPFGGAAKLWRLFASGDNLDEKIVNALTVRPMQRSFPSSAFLLPYESQNFWTKDDVFVVTPAKNYTIADYEQFANDIGFPTMYSMRKATSDLLDLPNMHPGVPVYCVHGWNIDTPEQFTYTGSMFPDQYPYVRYGQGDGTVNGRSLLGCEVWNSSSYHFEHVVFPKDAEHVQILANPDMIKYVMGLVGLS